jgi:antitoxin ParD1/3/4
MWLLKGSLFGLLFFAVGTIVFLNCVFAEAWSFCSRLRAGGSPSTVGRAPLAKIDNLCQQHYPWNHPIPRFLSMPMNISLTPHLEELIREKVASGSYNSASEVVREALRLLEQEDQLRALKLHNLRQDIRKGLDSGPSTVFDPQEIKRTARAKKSHKSAK